MSISVIGMRTVRSILSVLRNKEVQPVFRSLDMVEIDFEDIQCKKLKSSDSVVTASYILHLQCPFRIQNDKIVILESNDLYKPIGNAYQTDCEVENCGNMFDAKLPKANAKLCGKKVSKVSIDRDVLHIELENNLFIEIGLCEDESYESWRFFKLDGFSPHLIAYKNRFELNS